MKIRITATALADLEAGRNFYERQAAGVGDYFQDCLFSDVDSLVHDGGIHRVVFGFHRLLARRFPYAVYYRVEKEQVIVVYRILDCRRDPAHIRNSPT